MAEARMGEATARHPAVRLLAVQAGRMEALAVAGARMDRATPEDTVNP
jgi:hypothetical protein